MLRPWGNIEWLCKHFPTRKWSLLGCLGTEARSLAGWDYLKKNSRIETTHLLKIVDAPPKYQSATRFEETRNLRLKQREQEFIAGGGSIKSIFDHELLEPHGDIRSGIFSFAKEASRDVVIDVSSLPKRFFFPAIKLLLQSQDIENLLVLYTVPEGYPNEPLAMNHNDWAHLPFFSGDSIQNQVSMMIVGVGFEPLGLPDQVDHGTGLPVKLLLPFPAAPMSFQRSWELARKLEAHRSDDSLRIERVDSRSVSDCFDQLVTLTNQGTLSSELAPFGPKPMSVAMCLFAIAAGSPAFYTQPTAYHPDYSIGVSVKSGRPEIYAYCIRLGGRDLYDIAASRS